MPNTKGKGHSSPLKLFGELLSSESKEIGVILTYEVFVGIVLLTVPLGVQTVVNTFAFTQLAQPVLILGAAIFVGQGLGAFFRTIQIMIVEKIQQRLMAHVGLELAFRLPRIRPLKASNTVDLVNRFFDVVTVQKSISTLLLEGMTIILQMIIGLVLLGFYHPFLLVFDIILVVSILFVIFVMGRNAIATSVEESYQKYKIASWLREIASKSVTFSSKSARSFALERTDEIITEYLAARKSHFKIVRRQVVGLLSLQVVANTSLLVLGVFLILANQLSVGQLVAAEIVVSTVLYSLTRFQKHLESFYDLTAALDKIAYVFDLPLEHQGKIIPVLDGPIELEVRNISYTYPSLTKSFGPISFKLSPGYRMAVHGCNGSGKSTLVDLIFGFKELTSGNIFINKYDIREISPEILREQVALVRGVEILQKSVVKNVTLGKPSATRNEVRQALSKVGILDEVLNLPDGLDTILSENGAPLSVAQTKCLMLARAIIGEPKLLLIDEALDGLDEKSKSRALDTVLDKNAPWTVLITSQNSEVEIRADEILNLDILGGGERR